MAKFNPESPLYNFPLPEIEDWLRKMGCQQDIHNLNQWYVKQNDWEAQLILDTEDIFVNYFSAAEDGADIKRAFPYSLSRQDIEDAVFSGP